MKKEPSEKEKELLELAIWQLTKKEKKKNQESIGLVSGETTLQILNFHLFSTIQYAVSWYWVAGEAAVPSATSSQGKQPIYLQPFYAQTAFLFLTSVQYSINYMSYSTLTGWCMAKALSYCKVINLQVK